MIRIFARIMKDPWYRLRRYTHARIAQGSAGHAQTTDALLEFQLAHARARDAVHLPWDVEAFSRALAALDLQNILLATQVSDRTQYLKRPDLGGKLSLDSRERLAALPNSEADIALILSNGLSSTAMENHGLALLKAIFAAYQAPASSTISDDTPAMRIAPVCLVPNARVALSDEIGMLLRTKLCVIVLGERPGLSAPDSLGIYLTYHPKPENTNAERNCISNIRPPEGLSCESAAAKLRYLSEQALLRRLSGVELKDEMPDLLGYTSPTLIAPNE